MIGVSEADISPPVVMMAATLVRMAHPTNENLHNALSKAEARLFTHAWEVSGGVLKIESESNVGNFRLTDGDHCDCPTRKYICWHRGAYFILSVLAAATIAPLRSHLEPIAARPGTTTEDPASLGNFLDRPELAGAEVEDVSFVAPGVDDHETPAERVARIAFEDAPASFTPREARNLAYEAARATGASFHAATEAADRAQIVTLEARRPAPESALERAAYQAARDAYGRHFEEWIVEPRKGVYASQYAHGAAYQAALQQGCNQDMAHAAATQAMQTYQPKAASTPPPMETPVGRPSEPGKRARLTDAELEKRAKTAGVPRDRPEEYLWNTADYAEEETAEKITPIVKDRPFAIQPAITGGPPDPFDDVL